LWYILHGFEHYLKDIHADGDLIAFYIEGIKEEFMNTRIYLSCPLYLGMEFE
jgi:hypothetical protein